MYTNAAMTIYSYSKEGYTRNVVRGVLWQEVKQSNIEKTGLTSADSVKIFIPVENAPHNLDFTTNKDLVVKGEVLIDFDNTSSQTINASLTDLKADHDVYTITVADAKLFGSPAMQHYQLSCK